MSLNRYHVGKFLFAFAFALTVSPFPGRSFDLTVEDSGPGAKRIRIEYEAEDVALNVPAFQVEYSYDAAGRLQEKAFYGLFHSFDSYGSASRFIGRRIRTPMLVHGQEENLVDLYQHGVLRELGARILARQRVKDFRVELRESMGIEPSQPLNDEALICPKDRASCPKKEYFKLLHSICRFWVNYFCRVAYWAAWYERSSLSGLERQHSAAAAAAGELVRILPHHLPDPSSPDLREKDLALLNQLIERIIPKAIEMGSRSFRATYISPAAAKLSPKNLFMSAERAKQCNNPELGTEIRNLNNEGYVRIDTRALGPTFRTSRRHLIAISGASALRGERGGGDLHELQHLALEIGQFRR